MNTFVVFVFVKSNIVFVPVYFFVIVYYKRYITIFNRTPCKWIYKLLI